MSKSFTAYAKRDKRRLALHLTAELSARIGTPVRLTLTPRGKYPTGKFTVDMAACLPFVEHDDGRIDRLNTGYVEAAVAQFDERARAALPELGLTEYNIDAHPWDQGRGYVLAHEFPPLTLADESEASKYGRWMTADEVEAWRERVGADPDDRPFSDEAWIETHYAGINVFRSATFGDAA